MMTLGAVREVKTQPYMHDMLPPPTPIPLDEFPAPRWAEADYLRLKDLILTVSGVVLSCVVVLGCLHAALYEAGSAEDKTWARTLVIGIIAGFLGFLGGRQSRSGAATAERR